MTHRFPKWISYALLGFMAAEIGGAVYAALSPTPSPSVVVDAVFGLIGASLLAFLAWGYLYVTRFGIEVSVDGVSITGAFRTRVIPLNSIAQVITVSAPRSGTESWLMDKADVSLAKIDGGLVGFDTLLVELGEKLRPYQALFYRHGTLGSWEMQVAGDTKWVVTEAPNLVRKTSRRLTVIMAVGVILVFAAIAAATWQ